MIYVSWWHLASTLLFWIPSAPLRVSNSKFESHWKTTLCKFVLPLGLKYLTGKQLNIFDRQNVVAWMIFLYRVTITSLISENSIIYFKICIFYICATYMCIYAIENCKRYSSSTLKMPILFLFLSFLCWGGIHGLVDARQGFYHWTIPTTTVSFAIDWKINLVSEC